jgi:hypothetical protein
LVDGTNILEESVASAYRRVEIHYYSEDGGSTCHSFRKFHAAASQKITVVPFTAVVI